jgi:hypothetical protein
MPLAVRTFWALVDWAAEPIDAVYIRITRILRRSEYAWRVRCGD